MLSTDYELKKELEIQNKIISMLNLDLGFKNSQIQALTERNEFLEDLIAELTVQVYSTPPNV